jgi:predicted nucleic-acid-binding protein
MKGLDTNVLVRHLVQDDPAQSRLASTFIAQECGDKDPCFVNRIVLCELVWVLETAYRYPRETVSSALNGLMRTRQFRIEDLASAWRALECYRTGTADLADCLLGQTNRALGCPETVTFDEKAPRVAGFRLLTAG